MSDAYVLRQFLCGHYLYNNIFTVNFLSSSAAFLLVLLASLSCFSPPAFANLCSSPLTYFLRNSIASVNCKTPLISASVAWRLLFYLSIATIILARMLVFGSSVSDSSCISWISSSFVFTNVQGFISGELMSRAGVEMSSESLLMVLCSLFVRDI